MKVFIHGIEMFEQDGYRAYSEEGLSKLLNQPKPVKIEDIGSTIDYSVVKKQGKRLDLWHARPVGKTIWVSNAEWVK